MKYENVKLIIKSAHYKSSKPLASQSQTPCCLSAWLTYGIASSSSLCFFCTRKPFLWAWDFLTLHLRSAVVSNLHPNIFLENETSKRVVLLAPSKISPWISASAVNADDQRALAVRFRRFIGLHNFIAPAMFLHAFSAGSESAVLLAKVCPSGIWSNFSVWAVCFCLKFHGMFERWTQPLQNH